MSAAPRIEATLEFSKRLELGMPWKNYIEPKMKADKTWDYVVGLKKGPVNPDHTKAVARGDLLVPDEDGDPV